MGAWYSTLARCGVDDGDEGEAAEALRLRDAAAEHRRALARATSHEAAARRFDARLAELRARGATLSDVEREELNMLVDRRAVSERGALNARRAAFALEAQQETAADVALMERAAVVLARGTVAWSASGGAAGAFAMSNALLDVRLQRKEMDSALPRVRGERASRAMQPTQTTKERSEVVLFN